MARPRHSSLALTLVIAVAPTGVARARSRAGSRSAPFVSLGSSKLRAPQGAQRSRRAPYPRRPRFRVQSGADPLRSRPLGRALHLAPPKTARWGRARLAARRLWIAGGATAVAAMAGEADRPRSVMAAQLLAKLAAVDVLYRLLGDRQLARRVGLARALAYRVRIAPVFLQRLLRDRQLAVVRAAVRTAAGVAAPGLTARLAYLVWHYPRRVRADALRALARNPGQALARRTVQRALLHSSGLIRIAALRAVARAGAAWALPWVLRSVRDRRVGVRRVVAAQLGRFGATAAVLTALRRLRRDRSGGVRRVAARVYRRLQRLRPRSRR